MIKKWTVEFPVSDNLVWCYNGKFYETSDGITFFYLELPYVLIAVTISRNGQQIQTEEYHVTTGTVLFDTQVDIKTCRQEPYPMTLGYSLIRKRL